jgi:7-cyano-7-deazaguanine reductase
MSNAKGREEKMDDKQVYDNVMEGLRTLQPADRKRAFATIKREREANLKEEKKQLEMLPNSHWSKTHLLRRIANPTNAAYEQKIHIPEFTFLGVANQPDFGEVLITFYPGEWTIELKSLKVYKDAFRDSMASYERLANVVFEDLTEVFAPTRLRLMMRLRPRGGIASCLTIDSDWKIRGGDERFKDWQSNTDQFGFRLDGAVRV